MLLGKLKSFQIILASGSPRRKELLHSLGLEFQVFTAFNVEEDYPGDTNEDQIASYLAKKKSLAYPLQLAKNQILITADTIVALNGEVLLKPATKYEASEILRKISGESHFVYTGVCIRSETKITSFTSLTEVKFAKLTDEEINYYVTTYKPFDKAGAYGIQEWIGLVGVEEIKGSYFNVMGLPIQKLYKELEIFVTNK